MIHKNKIINPTNRALLFLLVSIVIIVFSSNLLFQRTVDLLTQNLRERLLTISITGAASIDSNDLLALQFEGDSAKPEWSKVVNQLHKIKYSNKDIVYMYIFRKKANNPSQMEFVADADSINPYANNSADKSLWVDVNRDGKVEPDGPDKLQWPGQEYPEAVDIPETIEAYSGPITGAELYTDDYGTVLSGYAPIKDSNGNVVAILATDIKADDFNKITNQTFFPFLIFIFALTLIISLLVVFIILAWKKYTRALKKLNNELEALVSQRESLMHLITHKVKGAFTRSKYIFAGLLDGTFGEISPMVKQIAEGGLKSDNSGISTVDLILNASNLQKGTVTFDNKVLDFKDSFMQVFNEKKNVAEMKNLKLEQVVEDGEYPLKGDPMWLKEVINNLVDNSLAYTKVGGATMSLAHVAGNRLLFKVKDTGVGISEEDKKVLFTEGGRGKESTKTNTDSTGYGLFTVKLVVEGHGGRVWAESEGVGKGSTFCVELPLTE